MFLKTWALHVSESAIGHDRRAQVGGLISFAAGDEVLVFGVLEALDFGIVVLLFEEFDALESPLVLGAALVDHLALLKYVFEAFGQLVWVLYLLLGHHIYTAHALQVVLDGLPALGHVVIDDESALGTHDGHIEEFHLDAQHG